MHLPRPRSLRLRLVLGATLLATVAVLASQGVGYTVLDSWLRDRVDQQLRDFHLPQRAYRDAVSPDGFPEHVRNTDMLPTDFQVRFYDASGGLQDEALGQEGDAGPELPQRAEGLDTAEGGLATVPADSGGGNWRVLRVAGPGGVQAVVGLPLATVEGATSKLLWLDLGLLAVAAGGLVVLGHGVVRVALRPLTRTERTAQRIAAGDLWLSLSDTDPRTEIGYLGSVLNTMLERLREALRQSAESEERLRRFVADAGHELRTPLTSIQGFAELTSRSEELTGEEQREAQRLIAQNAERMNVLIDDLVLLAKLGREPSYGNAPVDLLSAAADAVAAAAVSCPDRAVHLEPLRRRGPERAEGEAYERVEALGDPHRLRQVVGNLLTNALTHATAGTPVTVRVGTALAGTSAGGCERKGRTAGSPPLPRGEHICVVEVADEGPGLAEEDASRVFERFYRTDLSRYRDRGGSGLGLAIASVIAEGHGGRVEVDTVPGGGSTFRLVLPAHRPEGAA
ncbi:sensor histidine kinase [Streptomyces sulphureus]|uniref:sensor histidine kinase n=1 Tax=Streptomyces sulphureus TaxID=47758 RepID=UPI000379CFA7|nr:HAMP domain-containing sensor histidine kinase [Streptomyces sulphureus]